MAYVLEKIAPEHREKIIRDLAEIPGRQQDLIYARDHHDQFPKTWAIDRQRNCYMLSLPKLVREPVLGTYLLFFGGHSYLANSDDLFARRLYFSDEATPPASVAEEIKTEFKAALEVYGQWGTGPLDEFGNPTNAVMPAFIEKRG